MDKLLARIPNSIALRLVLAAAIVVIPGTLNVSWLGAAYQQVCWGRSFITTMMSFLFFSTAPIFLVGLAVYYPMERWVIHERARQSWQWVVVRLVLWTVAAVPVGWAVLLGMRFGTGAYPPIVESIYFVGCVVNASVNAILYTFLERAVETVRKREAALKSQIDELRIEIDEIRRTRQVAEITETAYFEELRSRAKELRRGS